jgi:hypothetical protein
MLERMSRRFLMFATDSFYPAGGWGDFVGAFDALQDAQAEAKRHSDRDAIEVVDLESLDVVWTASGYELRPCYGCGHDWGPWLPITEDRTVFLHVGSEPATKERQCQRAGCNARETDGMPWPLVPVVSPLSNRIRVRSEP